MQIISEEGNNVNINFFCWDKSFFFFLIFPIFSKITKMFLLRVRSQELPFGVEITKDYEEIRELHKGVRIE